MGLVTVEFNVCQPSYFPVANHPTECDPFYDNFKKTLNFHEI